MVRMNETAVGVTWQRELAELQSVVDVLAAEPVEVALVSYRRRPG